MDIRARQSITDNWGNIFMYSEGVCAVYTHVDSEGIENMGIGDGVPFLAIYISPAEGTMTWKSENTVRVEYHYRNKIQWSKIGDASFEIDNVNDTGNMSLTHAGPVQKILQLGNNLVIYTSGGVTILNPVSSPFAVYGNRQVNTIGVFSREAVCGTRSKHFFVDHHYRLCTLTETNPTVKVIGYEEYIKKLGTLLTVFYDDSDEVVFVSGATRGFTFREEEGLSGGFTALSVYSLLGNAVIGYNPYKFIQQECSIQTDVLDFGHKGLKTLESVEVGGTWNSLAEVAVDYNYTTQHDGWQTTAWFECNHLGIAFPRITATDFRVQCRLVPTQNLDFDISYLTLHWKQSDVRAIRGINLEAHYTV